jgi:hypothetical protein
MKRRNHERRRTEVEEKVSVCCCSIGTRLTENATHPFLLSIKMHHRVCLTVTNSVFSTNLLKGAEIP